MTKPEKRAAAKAAKAARAAAQRRRRALAGALAGLAVIVVVFGAVYLIVSRDGVDEATSSAGTSPAAAQDRPANQTGFPSLPEGADPALASKPAAQAGTGELAKLTVTPLIEGNGPAAQAGQQITVNYVGVSYRTGEEFDASWNRSQPYSFQLGAGRVIPGWDQGLVGAKVGSRVQLDIPSELAYGDSGQPAGPLRFIVDVLAVQ